MVNPLNQFLPQSQNRPNNPMAIISRFREFAAGMTPDGARKQVEQLLASGQMSQEQFNQLKAQAQEFSKFLK